MSEKIFDKVVIDNKFDVSDDFMKEVMSYAIPHAVDALESYWRSSDAEKIVSDSTFGFIWKNYKETRGDLLNVAFTVCTSHTRIKSLTEEFCKEFLVNLYALIEDNEDKEDVSLRIRLLPIADPKFDYLSQLCKFALDSEKIDLYTRWRKAGLCSSGDSAFYDYLWSKVKRQKGSVDIKINILEHAFDNNALSDSLLKKIAKSSPKNVKRLVTDKISRKINDKRHRVRRHERDTSDDSLAMAAFLKKEVDALEKKIMLFVDCTDREVVSNLMDCLSRDNLPWLMPSASKHHYLSRRLQQMVDSEE